MAHSFQEREVLFPHAIPPVSAESDQRAIKPRSLRLPFVWNTSLDHDMVRFDISDLRIFVNVVQAGSNTLGAERSHRAAASISARIKEMEIEMGAPLLTRARTGWCPPKPAATCWSTAFAR